MFSFFRKSIGFQLTDVSPERNFKPMDSGTSPVLSSDRAHNPGASYDAGQPVVITGTSSWDIYDR